MKGKTPLCLRNFELLLEIEELFFGIRDAQYKIRSGLGCQPLIFVKTHGIKPENEHHNWTYFSFPIVMLAYAFSRRRMVRGKWKPKKRTLKRTLSYAFSAIQHREGRKKRTQA